MPLPRGMLGWFDHVRGVFRKEYDGANAVLFVEGVGALVLLAIALALGFVFHLAWSDHSYVARLRRNDVPASCPWLPDKPDRPDPR